MELEACTWCGSRGRARRRLPRLRAGRGAPRGLLPARARRPLGDPGRALGRRRAAEPEPPAPATRASDRAARTARPSSLDSRTSCLSATAASTGSPTASAPRTTWRRGRRPAAAGSDAEICENRGHRRPRTGAEVRRRTRDPQVARPAISSRSVIRLRLVSSRPRRVRPSSASSAQVGRRRSGRNRPPPGAALRRARSGPIAAPPGRARPAGTTQLDPPMTLQDRRDLGLRAFRRPPVAHAEKSRPPPKSPNGPATTDLVRQSARPGPIWALPHRAPSSSRTARPRPRLAGLGLGRRPRTPGSAAPPASGFSTLGEWPAPWIRSVWAPRTCRVAGDRLLRAS